MLHRGIRCLALTAVLAGVASAAPRSSPADGTDVVLGQHTASGAEYRLTYRLESDGKPTETVLLGVGAGYDYQDDSTGHTVRDYALGRVYRVTPDRRFINDSLYAQVWFRSVELENRVRLAGALKAAGIDKKTDASGNSVASMSDPFWQETALGLIHPTWPRPRLERRQDGDRTRWLIGADEVVAVRYASEPAPQAVRPGLKLLWRQVERMHPQILEELTAGTQVLQELWAKAPRGPAFVHSHWTLLHAEWIEAAGFPLPRALAAAPTVTTPAYPDVFATLAASVAAHAAPPAPSVYVARVEDAVRRNAVFEAYLWVVEMDLAGGERPAACGDSDPRPSCSLMRRIGPALKADPRTALMTAGHAPDLADRARVDDVPNAYVSRLLWATQPRGKGVTPEQPESDLLEALRASPVANFTKDTGDFYARSWRPFEAWQVWDLGRLMAGHHDGDLLGSIDSLETQLEQTLPGYFHD